MVKGNLEGASSEAMLDSIQFLEEELQKETGLDIPIPLDREGVEVFFLPPSGDVLVYAENLMGMAEVDCRRLDRCGNFECIFPGRRK